MIEYNLQQVDMNWNENSGKYPVSRILERVADLITDMHFLDLHLRDLKIVNFEYLKMECIARDVYFIIF